MCAPAAALALAGTASATAGTAFTVQSALAVGSTFLGFVQQDRNARAQQQAQNEAYRANKNAATTDAINNYNSLNQRRAQEESKAAVEIQRVVRASRQATGTARAIGATHGVAGESIRTMLVDFEKKASTFTSGTNRNLRFMTEDIEARKRGTQSTLEGRIRSGLPDIIAKPSLLGAVLKAGAGAFDAFNDNTFIGADGKHHFGKLPSTSNN